MRLNLKFWPWGKRDNQGDDPFYRCLSAMAAAHQRPNDPPKLDDPVEDCKVKVSSPVNGAPKETKTITLGKTSVLNGVTLVCGRFEGSLPAEVDLVERIKTETLAFQSLIEIAKQHFEQKIDLPYGLEQISLYVCVEKNRKAFDNACAKAIGIYPALVNDYQTSKPWAKAFVEKHYPDMGFYFIEHMDDYIERQLRIQEGFSDNGDLSAIAVVTNSFKGPLPTNIVELGRLKLHCFALNTLINLARDHQKARSEPRVGIDQKLLFLAIVQENSTFHDLIRITIKSYPAFLDNYRYEWPALRDHVEKIYPGAGLYLIRMVNDYIEEKQKRDNTTDHNSSTPIEKKDKPMDYKLFGRAVPASAVLELMDVGFGCYLLSQSTVNNGTFTSPQGKKALSDSITMSFNRRVDYLVKENPLILEAIVEANEYVGQELENRQQGGAKFFFDLLKGYCGEKKVEQAVNQNQEAQRAVRSEVTLSEDDVRVFSSPLNPEYAMKAFVQRFVQILDNSKDDEQRDRLAYQVLALQWFYTGVPFNGLPNEFQKYAAQMGLNNNAGLNTMFARAWSKYNADNIIGTY